MNQRSLPVSSLMAATLLCIIAVSPISADNLNPVLDQPGTDFVFFAPDRPHLFRFVVQVDGRPFAVYQEQVLASLFEMLDKDGDGVLSGQERVHLPTPRTLSAIGISVATKSAFGNLLQQGPRSSVKTKEDLRTYVDRIGLNVLTLNAAPQASTPAPLRKGQLLFRALDADHDGQLTRTELQRAADSLRRMDLNGDEIWTHQELEALTAPTESSALGPADLVPLAPADALRPLQFGIDCVRRYPRISHTAQGAEIPDSPSHLPAEIARLDDDHVGRLSPIEWSSLLNHRRPDWIIVLQSQSSASRPTQVDIFDARGKLQNEIKGVTEPLEFPPVRLLLQADGTGGMSDEQAIREHFGRIDRDKNDYISRNEAGALAGMDFFETDADNDGKIFWEEYLAGVQPLLLITSLHTRMNLDEAGFDFFDAANSDPVSGLTLRELLNLPARSPQWDSNGDGVLMEVDLPKEYLLAISRGLKVEQLVSTGQSSMQREYRGFGEQRTVRLPEPIWFSKMDRNQDNDLSPHEFLGDLQTFERLDANHDGLIDRDEAIKFK